MSQLVLLAQKNTQLREELAFALRRHGYQVMAVSDGLGLSDILELARLSHGREPTPDVVVADAELDGYAGSDICAQLAHEEHPIPFILIGGTDCEGASVLLEKPISPETVVSAVASCLLSRAFGQGSRIADEIAERETIVLH